MANELTGLSVESYDHSWASEWDDMKKYGPFSRHVRRILLEMINRVRIDSVLDVGCGQGSFLAEIKQQQPNIKAYGVDISAVAVKLAQQKVPEGQFAVSNIAHSAPDFVCDLVICSEVLEHIPDDLAALQNLRRSSGRYLLVSAPQGRMRAFEKVVGHVRNYAPGELLAKIESSGFTILAVVEWGFPFYSPLYRNFLNLTGSKGTTGQFGKFRKFLSLAIYWLFRLNSSRRGDEIVILAEVNSKLSPSGA